MTTGRFKGTWGGVAASFMVDTGSELNLVSSSIYEDSNLPIDLDGTNWVLKGINGPAVRLGGCVRDVNVKISGHDFDHHFFVSREGVGVGRQDIILGQPWLQWYTASIDYNREGTMHMRIWHTGDRHSRPTLSIPLCKPGNTRNMQELDNGCKHHRLVKDHNHGEDDCMEEN